MGAKIKHVLFKLTGDEFGETKVINNRYQFVEGVMPANMTDSVALENVLCKYYGCEMEIVETEVQDIVDESAGNLTSASTRPNSAPANPSLNSDNTKASTDVDVANEPEVAKTPAKAK